MFLLDTDTLSHLQAGHQGIIKQLQALDEPDVGTTIITRIELMRGRFEFMLKAANGAELLRFSAHRGTACSNEYHFI